MAMEGRGGMTSADARYKFTGKERDLETNYDYFGARYYDARIARWLQVDPLAGKYPAWSPFNYVVGNPMTLIDPNGEEVRVYTERLGLGTYSRSASGFLGQVPPPLRLPALFIGAVAWEAFGPRHAFIRITTDSYDKTVELGGPLQGHREGNPLPPTDVGGSLEERPGQQEHSVERPAGVAQDDFSFENKILAIHATMSEYIKANGLPVFEGPTGPNSNGYAHFLIEAAGGKVSLPRTAVARNITAPYWQIYLQLLDEEEQKREKEQ
jgi:RHS repeat-associated protein